MHILALPHQVSSKLPNVCFKRIKPYKHWETEKGMLKYKVDELRFDFLKISTIDPLD